MNKGIVMEMSARHIIVMTPEGDFRKLPHDGRTCEVGEEILFAAPLAARKVPPMAKLSGLVAAVVMCIALVTVLTNMSGKAEIVAYVSMDINPSVEFGIDAAENVQDLKGLNDDGTELINGIDFRGKGMDTVAEALLTKADAGPLAGGDGEIVIASSLVKDTSKISDAAIADKLKEQVTKHIEAVYPQQSANYEVTAFAAPQEVRTAAEANGLSTGKYAIYLAAKNSGTDVPIEDFKTESIRQLAKSNEGVATVVKAQQPPTKAVFKQLLEDERSGKLSERMKELAAKKEASGDGKSDKSDDKNNKGKADSRDDSKKAADGKKDEKTNKSSGKTDTKNGSVTGPTSKPATSKGKTIGDDNSVDYRNGSKTNGKTNDNKNQQDDKATPPRKADDSKAGAKPADSSKNDDKKSDKDGNKSNGNDKSTNDKSTNDKNSSDKGNNDKNNSNDKSSNDKNSNDKSNGKSTYDKSNNDKNSNGKLGYNKDNSDKYSSGNSKDKDDKDNNGKSNGKDNNSKGDTSDRNGRS